MVCCGHSEPRQVIGGNSNENLQFKIVPVLKCGLVMPWKYLGAEKNENVRKCKSEEGP
jgi:hypothetical protein